MDEVIHINEDRQYEGSQNLNDSEGEPFPELYKDDNDLDDDDEDAIQLDEAGFQLPRPPTKPNVPIEDKTICPVCRQKGMRCRRVHMTSSYDILIVNIDKFYVTCGEQFFKLILQRPKEIITIFTMVAFAVIVAGHFFDELIKRLNPLISHVESIIGETKHL